jgi:hypothetical protein
MQKSVNVYLLQPRYLDRTFSCMQRFFFFSVNIFKRQNVGQIWFQNQSDKIERVYFWSFLLLHSSDNRGNISLNRAFIWSFLQVTIRVSNSTRFVLFCPLVEFHASSNPCSEFLVTTKPSSNVIGIFYRRFLEPPWKQPALLWSF